VRELYFVWIERQFEQQSFLSSSPFFGALTYIRERRAALCVFLDDPDVSIDTNHLERALRVIPLGGATGFLFGRNWAQNMSA